MSEMLLAPYPIHARNLGVLSSLGQKVRLTGSAAFRHTRQMVVPRRAGVYLLYDLRGVGTTRNLYRRFDQHYWLTANELIERAMRHPFGDLTFGWILVADDCQRTELERLLISWLRPPCNRRFPSTASTRRNDKWQL
jgi:hypothetical protein